MYGGIRGQELEGAHLFFVYQMELGKDRVQSQRHGYRL